MTEKISGMTVNSRGRLSEGNRVGVHAILSPKSLH